MVMLRHNIMLDPTCKQESYFRKACGTARMVWNWGLAEWDRQHKAGLKPNAMALHKQWNAIKYQQFPWLSEIHRDAHAQPIRNMKSAFKGFFEKRTGRPVFKKKGRCKDSFYLANDVFWLDGKRVKMPKIGMVKMCEPLRFEGKIMSAIVSRTADRWFLSVCVEIPNETVARKRTADKVVGIDLGLKAAMTLSTGESIAPPRPLAKSMKRLKRLSRSHSRKQKGSKNKAKASMILARHHARVANIRRDFWHKATNDLCKNHALIGIEDLNIRGMARTRLSKSIADVGLGAFKPMLMQKAAMYGTRIVEVGRFYPSSKTCSSCGTINKELKLSDRHWTCTCGASHDRDINAAINLANSALLAASEKVTPVRDDTMLKVSRGRNQSKSLESKS